MFRNPSGNALCLYDTLVKAGQLECAVLSTGTASATPLIWRLLAHGIPGALPGKTTGREAISL
jgi:hypothetical protein